MNNQRTPRWDLANIYPSLDSSEFKQDFEEFKRSLQKISDFVDTALLPVPSSIQIEKLAALVHELLDCMNSAYRLNGKLRAYIRSFVTTDSFNQQAKRLSSEYEVAVVQLQKQQVKIDRWIGTISDLLAEIFLLDDTVKRHTFYLQETAQQSRFLMSDVEEALAAELNLSGANAWNKLQGTVTSQLSVEIELDGEIKAMPMPALINLRSHPDESVRKKAYEAELAAWEKVSEPLASAINGVKGTVNTLNRKRGREDALHSALDSARIDRQTLEALLGAMQDSFADFHRYFNTKAARLGKPKLAWWDIFAPLGGIKTTYSFQAARDLILEHFGKFSPDLKSLAQHAFDHNWIDAEQRVGKRGGAFCMAIPGVNESRILCNFDGSLDQVFTIAHELGHAYHNHCKFRAGKTELQATTPMTLAETASIFCETIITDAILDQVANPAEELAILETALIGDAQVIVDIYSRYLFEKEVFERRALAELNADELCEIMEKAQKATYGVGLDEDHLHKYMWTWKPHYYYPGLSFYNFPYTFGLLFGIGLYAIFQQRGGEFIPDYVNLLASTGEASAADLASRFGIDIRTTDFWVSSISVVKKRIDRYCAL